jgi:hypothetical protein
LLRLAPWQAALLGLALITAAVLLATWWRQHSYRWGILLVLCLLLAPGLSYWSGLAFEVSPYRAGCDGICPGQRGAPIPTYACDIAGCQFSPVGFALNSLVYLVLLLAWGAVVYALLSSMPELSGRRAMGRFVIGAVLLAGPFLLAPVYLPPPHAHVRGDSQRVAINAQREVFMYDNRSPLPVVRAALDDVRPRPDHKPGLRVCLRTYTYFYLPIGFMYLDMTPEGVHSNQGGILPRVASCWN